MGLKFFKLKIHHFKTIILLTLIAAMSLFFLNCSHSDANISGGPPAAADSPPISDPPPAEDYQYKRLSPYGGFVSSVVYRPNQADEVWASGDDSSGLFSSQNGGTTWSTLSTGPLDHSTYALTFDPNDNKVIYSPDHFGRGLMKSTDEGSTWQNYLTGLPTDNNSDERINDLDIDPNSTQTIYMALTGGLFKSTNGGQIFSQITHSVFTTNTDTNFRSVKIRRVNSSNTQVFLGSEKGRVYKSTDDGTTWIELTAGGYLPVTDLAVTNNALYVGFSDGTILKSTTFNFNSFSFVNNATSGAVIESGMWTKIKAVSGGSAATDQLFIGTTYKTGSTKWGFFYSSNGGATLQKRVTGLNNSSTFSIAVNPSDSNEIIIGTINNGIYKTSDQGLNWSEISQGIQATATLAFAENPSDTNNILMSSTAGLDGTSKVFESTTGGTSWSEISFFSDKSVRSLLMPSNDGNIVIAGTHRKGIYKTTNGISGAWTQVNNADVIFSSLKKDSANASTLYASGYEPNGAPALGGYVSTDAGNSWTKKIAFPVVDIIPHPSTAGIAVAVTGDVFGTSDSFSSTSNSLGLATFAPGEIFFSAAFIPGTDTLLVGSSEAKLYKTTNFNASGAGVTWQNVALPTSSVAIKSIVVVNAQTWYVSAFNADIHIKPTSTPAILRTKDSGATWEFLNEGLAPSRLVFQIYPSLHQSNRFYLGMWGSGLLSLTF